ncbi:MAG: hypothetical protein A2015_11845 [Spirochaetes bacterium GWF1_31_7]|nr:MAG: hypothetical protein A2Y30_15230 [Spirochaetes bacterium GWE1_32_154]OHD49111.1 MAG: hypothetical protein A2015_11845 [Spirochaetes bacterium GWF1_31_7]OHD50303.1 MAG: hypothetical protein A2Y29_13280 [Spirochaetes bacterium GWE2_31_10]OHD77455.1 MAG: hypothetical protein A2355_09920 [Spirochaetes bacterium RIFOXYB1_FULL_32_8]HBD93909.1 hypothetical protein [Spirochaetia bacterium]
MTLRVKQIFKPDLKTKQVIPLLITPIKAGFPSPAEDYVDKSLDLNEFLITHPSATYFFWVEGTSMVDAHIISDDLLVVDRLENAVDGDIVIASIDNDFTVKTFRKTKDKVYLQAENEEFENIELKQGMELQIWGVVTALIRPIKNKKRKYN